MPLWFVVNKGGYCGIYSTFVECDTIEEAFRLFTDYFKSKNREIKFKLEDIYIIKPKTVCDIHHIC